MWARPHEDSYAFPPKMCLSPTCILHPPLILPFKIPIQLLWVPSPTLKTPYTMHADSWRRKSIVPDIHGPAGCRFETFHDPQSRAQSAGLYNSEVPVVDRRRLLASMPGQADSKAYRRAIIRNGKGLVLGNFVYYGRTRVFGS